MSRPRLRSPSRYDAFFQTMLNILLCRSRPAWMVARLNANGIHSLPHLCDSVLFFLLFRGGMDVLWAHQRYIRCVLPHVASPSSAVVVVGRFSGCCVRCVRARFLLVLVGCSACECIPCHVAWHAAPLCVFRNGHPNNNSAAGAHRCPKRALRPYFFYIRWQPNKITTTYHQGYVVAGRQRDGRVPLRRGRLHPHHQPPGTPKQEDNPHNIVRDLQRKFVRPIHQCVHACVCLWCFFWHVDDDTLMHDFSPFSLCRASFPHSARPRTRPHAHSPARTDARSHARHVLLWCVQKTTKNAHMNLGTVSKHLAFLKDQITISEVNIARVHNHKVFLRQQEKAASGGSS